MLEIMICMNGRLVLYYNSFMKNVYFCTIKNVIDCSACCDSFIRFSITE